MGKGTSWNISGFTGFLVVYLQPLIYFYEEWKGAG